MSALRKQLPFITFIGESTFANSLEDIRNIPEKVIFVNVKGQKLENNMFNSYRDAVEYALALPYEANQVFINVQSKEKYCLDEIDC